MYTQYFGLKEKPFNLTPSPRFLYLSESHKEALALLTYGVTDRKGFVLLTGEVGTGKTTILHALLGTLDKRVQCVHLSNPLLSPAEFVHYLAHAVFKSESEVRSKTEFLLQFEEYLRRSAQNQSNFLLVIDEAQKLSFDLLEEIRLLSNMETEDQKLINIFLVGQPELNEKLSETRCRPLLQRISIRHHISPMSEKETGEYIDTRLKVAGAKDPGAIFPSGGIRAIHRCSRGYPRMINILADNALLLAYSKDSKKITAKMIEQCYGDLQLATSPEAPSQNAPSWHAPQKEEQKRVPSRKAWGWAAAALIVMALASLALWSWNDALMKKLRSAGNEYSQLRGPVVPKPMVALPVAPEEKGGGAGAPVQPEAPPAQPPEKKAEPVPQPLEKRAEPAPQPPEKKAESVPQPLEKKAEPAPQPPPEPTHLAKAPAPEPVTVKAAEPLKPEVVVLRRRLTAKRGDTLSKLALDVYGRVDNRILQLLQKSNPSISNIHWISVGQEIYFPPVQKAEEDKG